MKGLQQIKMMLAREQVASVLREAILTKKLREGESLVQGDIAAQLGVSSTPVREALQMLAAEGLVQLQPNKAATVKGINRKFIEDFYQIRAILESESAAEVCRKKIDIKNIAEAFEQAEAVVDSQRFQQYQHVNQMFHLAIWNAAGNERIMHLLSSMWIGSSAGSNVSEEVFAKISMEEHAAIMAALQESNAQSAREAMYSHIIRSRDRILTRYE